MSFSINGNPYTIVDQSKVKTGRRTYQEVMRPSQPFESGIAFKTWRLSGPMGGSRQRAYGDPLGPDYTIDLDGRNENLLTSAAKRNTASLTGSQASVEAAPNSTTSTTNWSETNAGGTDGSAHNELDSFGTPDDALYWETSTDDSAFLIVGIASQTDPQIDTGHIVRARVVAPSGNTANVGVKLRMYDDAVIIATSDEITINPTTAVALLDSWTTGQDAVPTHSTSAGANRLLLAMVTTDHDANALNDLTALTYGGQAMTQYGSAVSEAGTGSQRVEIWYLKETGVAAASGTTLAPTWDNGTPDHGTAYSLATFSNVHQTTPISGDASDIERLILSMTPLAVNNGDYVVAAAVNGHSSAGTWTATAGYTERLDAAISDSNHHLQDKAITSAGTESVTATFSIDRSPDRAAGMAVVVQGATSGADTAENISFTVPEANIATLSDHAGIRMGIAASTISGSDSIRVTEMQFDLPSLDVNNVIGINEQDGQVFIDRGDRTAQLNPGDMTEVGSPQDHGSAITDSVASWLGAGYVAFGGNKVVQKRTAVTNAGSTYANVASVNFTKMAVGPDRLWGVVADGGVDDGEVAYAVAALTTANLSNGIPVADTNSGHITGLYTLGELMVAGTQRGPRSFTDAGAPAVLGEAVADFPSTINGASGGSLWGWHYHGTKLGTYAISPDGRIENPVGPGEGHEGLAFEGPIDGFPTAIKPFKDSLWAAYLTSTGDTYLLRGVFNPQITPGSGRPDWYVVRKLTGVECHAIGATTGRAVPALVWGEDDGVSYADLAYRGREIADTTNYAFGTGGGQWFGMTLMMPVGLTGNVRWAKFFSENCNSTNTWQLALSSDEGDYVDIGSAVTTNGSRTVRPVSSSVPLATVSFATLKPRLTQVASSEVNPPQLRGDLTIAYDERPEFVREVDVLIEGNGSDLATLQALVGDDQKRPVPIRLPSQTDVNTDLYGYVSAAQWYDRTNPDDNVIMLKVVEWELS